MGPPAVALYHTLELGAPVRRHAEAIDDDVADLVHAIARAQPPINFDRLNRPGLPGPAGDLAGDDRPIPDGLRVASRSNWCAEGAHRRPWPGAAFDPRLRHQRHGSSARCRRRRVRARRRRVWRNKPPVGRSVKGHFRSSRSPRTRGCLGAGAAVIDPLPTFGPAYDPAPLDFPKWALCGNRRIGRTRDPY